MYFQCHLPAKAPGYMPDDLRNKMQTVLDQVYARMEKLESALIISGLGGAAFAEQAALIFKNKPAAFNAMSDSDLARTVMALYDGVPVEPRLEWQNCDVVVDTAFVNTTEWEYIRRFGVGGSEAAVIMDFLPYHSGSSSKTIYRTKRDIFYDKTGIPEQKPEEGKQAIFKRGHFLEDDVVNVFCERTGAKRIKETRMFRSRMYPHATANVDAFVVMPNGDIFVFEAKTTVAENWDAWADGKIPIQYIPQTRQYPAVMADDRIKGTFIGCLFTYDTVVSGTYLGSSFDPKKFLSRRIDRDEAKEKEQLEAEEAYWNDYIETQTLPPYSGDPRRDIKTIDRYTAPADKSAAPLTLALSDFESDINEYIRIGAERSLAEANVDALKTQQQQLSTRLIEALGTNVEAAIPIDSGSYFEVKYAPRKKTSVDYETLEALFPEAFKKCVTTQDEACRVFTIKKRNTRKK